MDILALIPSKKFQNALEGLSETKATFKGLADSLSEEKNQEWKWQETQASRHRGDAFKIYEVHQEKGPCVLLWVLWFECWLSYAVPSQADIRLKLTKHENKCGLQSGIISWLVAGINIEDSQ